MTIKITQTISQEEFGRIAHLAGVDLKNLDLSVNDFMVRGGGSNGVEMSFGLVVKSKGE